MCNSPSDSLFDLTYIVIDADALDSQRSKQEAQASPATYSSEDSTFGDLATVASVHISCKDVKYKFSCYLCMLGTCARCWTRR